MFWKSKSILLTLITVALLGVGLICKNTKIGADWVVDGIIIGSFVNLFSSILFFAVVESPKQKEEIQKKNQVLAEVHFTVQHFLDGIAVVCKEYVKTTNDPVWQWGLSSVSSITQAAIGIDFEAVYSEFDGRKYSWRDYVEHLLLSYQSKLDSIMHDYYSLLDTALLDSMQKTSNGFGNRIYICDSEGQWNESFWMTENERMFHVFRSYELLEAIITSTIVTADIINPDIAKTFFDRCDKIRKRNTTPPPGL